MVERSCSDLMMRVRSTLPGKAQCRMSLELSWSICFNECFLGAKAGRGFPKDDPTGARFFGCETGSTQKIQANHADIC